MRRSIKRKCGIMINNPILLRPVVTLQDAEENLACQAHVPCGKESVALSEHGQLLCAHHAGVLVERGFKVTKL